MNFYVPDSKSGVLSKVPWVRIPPSPPYMTAEPLSTGLFVFEVLLPTTLPTRKTKLEAIKLIENLTSDFKISSYSRIQSASPEVVSPNPAGSHPNTWLSSGKFNSEAYSTRGNIFYWYFSIVSIHNIFGEPQANSRTINFVCVVQIKDLIN